MRADLLLLANRSDTWTYQVLHALQDLSTSQQLLDAIRSRQTINLGQFELTLRERFLVWLQAFFQASAQMPTRGIYSDVTLRTLPYLTFVRLSQIKFNCHSCKV